MALCAYSGLKKKFPWNMFVLYCNEPRKAATYTIMPGKMRPKPERVLQGLTQPDCKKLLLVQEHRTAMSDIPLHAEETKKDAGPGHTEESRASIVFAVMQLNRMAEDAPYENRNDFIEVIKNADFCSWEPGSVIIEQGSQAERLYVILAGSAAVSPGDGQQAVLEKGSLVGQVSLLTNEPYGSTVIAGDRGLSMLAIKKEALLANPAVYRSLLGRGPSIKGSTCDYELGEKLGEGSTGQVYEIQGHRLCAKIYRLRSDGGSAPPAAIPESILLLRHPHIVSLYENVSAHGSQFIIMDRARGITIRDKNGAPALCRTLRQMMDVFQSEQQCVSLDMTAKVFRHVAAALLYIHEQGFVHRDVKPEHIFIDVSDNDISFMLSDFSLAFPISTRPGKIEGTPHYCPPEAIDIGRSETVIAGSADYYSLAAVCFELLTGQTVFGSSNVLELARQHLEAEPDLSHLPANTPIWLGNFIKQALEKDPALRPGRQDMEKLISVA